MHAGLSLLPQSCFYRVDRLRARGCNSIISEPHYLGKSTTGCINHSRAMLPCWLQPQSNPAALYKRTSLSQMPKEQLLFLCRAVQVASTLAAFRARRTSREPSSSALWAISSHATTSCK
jgi:hypothetical protein